MTPNDINQLGRYISIIQRNTQIALNHRLDIPDLTASKAHLLLFINDYKSVTAQQVADQLAINKGLVSREFAELVDSGYILKTPDQTDGRLIWISLLPKGITACKHINHLLAAWWEEQFVASKINNKDVIYQELYKLASTISGLSLQYSQD